LLYHGSFDSGKVMSKLPIRPKQRASKIVTSCIEQAQIIPLEQRTLASPKYAGRSTCILTANGTNPSIQRYRIPSILAGSKGTDGSLANNTTKNLALAAKVAPHTEPRLVKEAVRQIWGHYGPTSSWTRQKNFGGRSWCVAEALHEWNTE
jgi:hypothetical protein